MTFIECICNIFGCCARERTDDVEKKPKDDGRRVSFDLENNVYYEGLAVHSKVLVNPKSSFDSVDLTGSDNQEASSGVG